MDSRHTWLEVNMAAIRSNFAKMSGRIRPCRILAVLKNDAYGLGALPIARALKQEGVYGFGVAEVREALPLLELGLPVHIMGGLVEGEIAEVVRAGLVAAITDESIARALSAEALRQKRTVACHYLVDTGMGRQGILARDAERIIAGIHALPGLNPLGIYSHFPHANEDTAFSESQVELLSGLLARLEKRGISFAWRHIANSDGINNIAAAYKAPFNLARTAINLYGALGGGGCEAGALEPAVRLMARLIGIRELPAGATIGYNRTHRLEKPARVGTLSIGYADGLPLALSNRGAVLIGGRRCPVIGRVSMDYTTVNLENAPGARVWDTATCLGDGITIGEWARIKGTHEYDILCAIGPRPERRYVNAAT
ncbi:MAG: alanine racemase [Lentisphaerae bacterium]|nr:alanine racemase [Lentisphaerota bacterium]